MPRGDRKLTPRADGGWTARKRIPHDVREAFDGRWEERFQCGAMPTVLARAKHREWLSEIDARISNARAAKRGAGLMLTPMGAAGLCGDWYHWFVARHVPNAKAWGADYWEDRLGEAGDAIHDAVWQANGEPWRPDIDPLEIADHDTAAKQRALAVVADHAETSQFLYAKGLALEPASREMFLDCVLHSYPAALRLLTKRAKNDYSPDTYSERFPKFERTADPGLSPWDLFERWVRQTKPADATVNRWRVALEKLTEQFPSAAAITSDEAQRWADGLVTSERTATTVRDVWVVACRTVFAWAVRRKLIKDNPFTHDKLSVEVPRKQRNRDVSELRNDEIQTILGAALAIGKLKTKWDAARRWVFWLQAYTGARAGEITQLRGADVIKRDGTDALTIKPEAGTVKTGQARTVPIHEHLIEQGFLTFVRKSGHGPLFYAEPTATRESNPTKPQRPRAVVTRTHLADWVRKLGVNDPELQPTHAWRDTFKAIARRNSIKDEFIRAIMGHAPADVAGGYAEPTLRDKAEALKRFPRYEITAGTVRDAAKPMEGTSG